MHILLLEPYFTGSHQNWVEEYARYSGHTVTILSLPGRFWKWRMQGGAVILAQRFLSLPAPPDVIVATDMLNLPLFQALTRRRSHHIPCALYFHENQLTYPWSATDRDLAAGRDAHYSFINYASALAADALFFNSPFHHASFFEALPRFLSHFPDFNQLDTVAGLQAKARVLPLGLDLRRFDAYRPPAQESAPRPPLILWNHRWEYDKNPADFFDALYVLAERGLEFKVAILGQNFRKRPVEFTAARQKLGRRVVAFGYQPSFAGYAHRLWQADFLPVTSRHDFFGASVVQAMYCQCYPLLPDRLGYPALLPQPLHPHCLYHSQEELIEKLADLIVRHPQPLPGALPAHTRRFDWLHLAAKYDRAFARLRHRAT
ncbi:MAG: DUF3524 domain-containing protein [Anaerolineae bacterium]